MKDLNLNDYYQPESLQEAISILDEKKNKNIEVIAGGTEITLKHLNTNYLVDINDLGLKYVQKKDKEIKIGATTTIGEIEESQYIQKDQYRALYDAAYHWTENVKYQATIGGSICEAVPSSDMAAPLIALEAKAIIEGTEGEKSVKIEDIATSFGEIILEKNEILKEFIIPNYGKNTLSSFQRIVRTEHDVTLTGVALRLDMDGNIIENASIGVEVADEVPVKATETEETLEGEKLNEKTINKAMNKICNDCSPRSSLRASKEYREHLEEVLLKKALNECKEEI